MRILFFIPEYHTKGMKPIGVSLLSAILKKDGHEIEIFDTMMHRLDPQFTNKNNYPIFFKPIKKARKYPFPTETDVKQAYEEKMESFKPDILAVTSTYLQFKLFVHLFSRWGHPGIPVIVGGFQAPPKYINPLDYSFVDMVCLGEGDEAFPELLRSMESGENRKDIKNICFKENGSVIINELRPQLKDLDNLPFVDWSIYPKHYLEKPFEGDWWFGGDLMHSRGCFNRCNYCFYDAYLNLYNKKSNNIRFMTPERSVEELEYVFKEYNVNLLKMRDSDFFAHSTNSLAKMVELFNKKKEMPHLIVNAYPPHVTEEKMKLISQLNCVSIGLGVETGNEELRRDVLKKRGNNKQILKAVELIKKYNIRISSLNMMGIPGESRKTYMDTVFINKKMDVEVSDISMLYPFPGTGIYKLAKEKKLITEDFDNVIYFRDETTLDMENYSREEMSNLIKVFTYYVKFPKILFPIIQLAEKNNKIGGLILNLLNYMLTILYNLKRMRSD